MKDECIKAIIGRTSVRRYSEEEVSEGDLEDILQTAVSAPSAGNRQPWRIVVVRDVARKKKLVEAAGGQGFIAQAPIALVIIAVPYESAERYGDRGSSLYVYQDTAALTQNILIAAHRLGYGTCWVGAFNEEAARGAVNVPGDMRPVAIIPIGKALGDIIRRQRRPLSEVVVQEKF
ncbi:MAG: nitroreductase family protein [Candidatus Thorarchaeota archaeon]|nr:nitroreductase family protein [Candidatus Thorarchaeota archaeon]